MWGKERYPHNRNKAPDTDSDGTCAVTYHVEHGGKVTQSVLGVSSCCREPDAERMVDKAVIEVSPDGFASRVSLVVKSDARELLPICTLGCS